MLRVPLVVLHADVCVRCYLRCFCACCLLCWVVDLVVDVVVCVRVVDHVAGYVAMFGDLASVEYVFHCVVFWRCY